MWRLYSLLAMIGTALPYLAFIDWLSSAELSMASVTEAIFSNKLSLFAWSDVAISALALILFILVDGQKNQINQRFWAIAGTCLVGVSLGLPLYLAQRDYQLHKRTTSH
ncbi:DUF2834 domain-containing protein [Halioxenophilus sp. WMMB6]|uniref:DUF2834 domain-containing protein n=1 Tax=Halioxenophilus sp. WMMB6 TaxID=3073815 RepID=UPI00295EE47D|nr:DUF2834 domain-containing protein [Halioxenophilus sp. WMMB6]